MTGFPDKAVMAELTAKMLLEVDAVRFMTDKRYTALLDREKLGLHVCALAHIHLTRHTEGGVEQFEREIATCPEVTECYSTTGESDYILKIVAPDIKAYDSFLHERIFKIPAVAQVRTSVVLREIKFDTQLPL